MTAIWTTIFVESWRKREQTLLFEWDLGILKDRYEGAERSRFHFMSMYDSNTNVRTKTSTRNRTLAQAENSLFRLFMFTAVGVVVYTLDAPEADAGPVTGAAIAETTLEDLKENFTGKGLYLALIAMAFDIIYRKCSNYFIDEMNFKYAHEHEDYSTFQVFEFGFFNTFFPFGLLAFSPKNIPEVGATDNP